MSRGPPSPTHDNLVKVSLERLRAVEQAAQDRAYTESVASARKAEKKDVLEHRYKDYLNDRREKELARRKKLEEDKFELRQKREEWLRERRENETKERSQALDNNRWRRKFWEEERAAKQNSVKGARERGRADLKQMQLIDQRWRESMEEFHRQEEKERAQVIEDNGNWRKHISETIRELQTVKPVVFASRQQGFVDESTYHQEVSSAIQEEDEISSPRRDLSASLDGSGQALYDK